MPRVNLVAVNLCLESGYMEIAAERAPMAQQGQPPSHNVPPFTPTHHLRNGFLSFTEFLLRNVEEWSKPHAPWPVPPPPIAFSGSDRFIKGRLPHRTLAISASLSSLFDDAATPLLDASNHGNGHVEHDHTTAKAQRRTHDGTLHCDDDIVSAAGTQCNTSIHAVPSDDAHKSDEAGTSVQFPCSNDTVDVFACSTDNTVKVCATLAGYQDGISVSMNETVDVSACGTNNLLPDDSQHAHGSDDVVFQCNREDVRVVQSLNKAGVPDGFDCSPSTAKVLEGSVYVSDNTPPDKNCLHMNNEGHLALSGDSSEDTFGGGENATNTPVNVISRGDSNGVAKLPLQSLLKSPNDNSLTGHMARVSDLSPLSSSKSLNNDTLMCDADGLVEFSLLSPTKHHNDNNLAGSCQSSSKCCNNENNLKGDMGAPELSLPSMKRNHYGVNSTGDADGVIELSLPSQDADELSFLSSQKNNNASNLTGNAEGVAELQLLPSTDIFNGKTLPNTFMEAPVVLPLDEQVQDLEEGELSERLSDDKCNEVSEDGKMVKEGENGSPNAIQVESKASESSTDDEMNQPISLFISRYRTRSASTQIVPPLDTGSNIKTKCKTGKKRKIEKPEEVVKDVTNRDMAVTGKLTHAKVVRKGRSKVARVLNDYNNSGPLDVANRLSLASKFGMSESKDDVEQSYAELGAMQAQIMGTPTVVLGEKGDGASHTHSNRLTQHGLAGTEHLVATEEDGVSCAHRNGLTQHDLAGNEHLVALEDARMWKLTKALYLLFGCF